MKRYSFLFSARWVRYIALALLAAVVCGMLANWQNNRREQRDAEIAHIETNYTAAPVDLDEVLTSTDQQLAEDEEWTRVESTGTFDTADTVLARNRAVDTQVGYYVVTPFTTDGGLTVMVVRGWIPAPSSGGTPSAGAIPAPASGEVTLTGWLRPTQDGEGEENPAGQIKALDPDNVPGMESGAENIYVEAQNEDPAGAEGLTDLPEPSTDPGSHLSYTMQWITFGIMILIAVVWGARKEREAREARSGAEDGGAEAATEYVVVDKELLKRGAKPSTGPRYAHGEAQAPVVAPTKKRRKKQESEEEYEDSILDSHGL